MRIVDFFDAATERFRDQCCLVHGDESWTYREVQSLSRRAAKGWQSLGVGPGDRVIVWGPNDAQTFLGMLSLQRAGAVLVPQNPRAASLQVEDVALRFGCTSMLVHPAVAQAAGEAGELSSRMRHVVLTMEDGTTRPSLGRWFESEDEDCAELPVDRDRVVRISTTSGTTGKPKGILTTELSHESMIANVLASLRYDSPPVYLVAAPLSHVAGHLMMPHFVLGGTVVIIERADPDAMIEAIRRHSVTTVFVPPTVLYRLLADEGMKRENFASMRYLLVAGAPAAPGKLAEAIERIGPKVAQFYAQGEAPAMISMMLPADYLRSDGTLDPGRLASCGRETQFVRTTVLDDAGAELAPGLVGEIATRGNNLMIGYWEDGRLTSPERPNGWHRTGDVGYKDVEGFLYIVDRKKDMIISGGFNVFPAEVEAVLLGHPDVEECAVVGVPDQEWGEAVKAVVQCKPGILVDEAQLAEQLITRCRAALGPIKAPKSVEVWAEIPRSPVGKVLRREVRDRYWTGGSRIL